LPAHGTAVSRPEGNCSHSIGPASWLCCTSELMLLPNVPVPRTGCGRGSARRISSSASWKLARSGEPITCVTISTCFHRAPGRWRRIGRRRPSRSDWSLPATTHVMMETATAAKVTTPPWKTAA
jgi:hypothetical protein